jgi:hypothetical protein
VSERVEPLLFNDLQTDIPTRYNVVVGPVGLGNGNQCAGEDQQQFSSQSVLPELLVNSDPDHSDVITLHVCKVNFIDILKKMAHDTNSLYVM